MRGLTLETNCLRRCSPTTVITTKAILIGLKAHEFLFHAL